MIHNLPIRMCSVGIALRRFLVEALFPNTKYTSCKEGFSQVNFLYEIFTLLLLDSLFSSSSSWFSVFTQTNSTVLIFLLFGACFFKWK
jgi:hypothetical protein